MTKRELIEELLELRTLSDTESTYETSNLINEMLNWVKGQGGDGATAEQPASSKSIFKFQVVDKAGNGVELHVAFSRKPPKRWLKLLKLHSKNTLIRNWRKEATYLFVADIPSFSTASYSEIDYLFQRLKKHIVG